MEAAAIYGDEVYFFKLVGRTMRNDSGYETTTKYDEELEMKIKYNALCNSSGLMNFNY